jgi:hypothetical protein
LGAFSNATNGLESLAHAFIIISTPERLINSCGERRDGRPDIEAENRTTL